jgi:hypothetical protein
MLTDAPTLGDERNRAGNIRDVGRSKYATRLAGGQIDRQCRERSDQRAAAIGCGRDHESGAEDYERHRTGGNQAFGLAFRNAEGRLIIMLSSGYREMNQKNRMGLRFERI